MYVLFYIIFAIVISVITNMIGLGFLTTIYSLGLLLPTVSIAARRLHDTGRTGWWQLIGLIPLIGLIVLLIFYTQKSHPGSNEYGANPLGE